MKPAETFFEIGSILDADTSGGASHVATLTEALDVFCRLHKSRAAMWVYEVHPGKGRLLILDYSPYSGLMREKSYIPHNARWEVQPPAHEVWAEQMLASFNKQQS